MKTNKFFGLAVLACGFALSFTSCSNEDVPVTGKKQATVSFEKKSLGADGYWCGDETGTKFDNWGADAFACQYQEKGVTFPVNYTPKWGSWTGFAISNRTATTYKSIVPDQFNSAVGEAKNGYNYCVVYTFGETIDFGRAVTLKGFWYTNEAWAVYAFKNGDGYTPGVFEKDDWFKCTVTATLADGTTKDVEIYLAKDGDYVKDWQFCDFQSLENVTSLSFAFDSTKKNDYGVTTPTYMCIDDITFEY
jgi:hypothetical protein